MKIIVVDLIFSVKLIRALETLNTRMPLFPYQVLVRGVKSNFFSRLRDRITIAFSLDSIRELHRIFQRSIQE